MGKSIEIIRKSEVKIACLFAGITLFTVLLVGIINRIEFIVIVKRIIISEIFFIPIGLIVGYIYKSMFKPLIDQVTVQSSEQGIDSEIDHRISDNGNEKTADQEIVSKDEASKDATSEGDKDSFEKSGNIIDEIVGDANIPGEVNAEGSDTVKEMGKSNLGKHIIVDDKKIINDPKLMAKAVRTIMNKE